MKNGNYEQISTRALSKEANSGENSSFRVYYGGAAVAIPFRWESRPGTPKHTFSPTSLLPPLTPPPSYYSSPHCTSKPSSKQTLLSSLFPRFTPRKSRTSLSSSSVSSSSSFVSWSSSHSSSPSRPKFFKRHRRRHSLDSPSLPFEYNVDGDHEPGGTGPSNSPRSTLCFSDCSMIRASCFRGCYPLVNVKKALMSIVGHGSRGTLN